MYRIIESEIPISIAVSQNGTKVAEKQVIIHFDGSTFFTVEPSGDVIITDSLQLPSPNPDTIDEAVSRAVKSQGKSYLAGEVATEGHIILDTEEKDGQIKVYTIASIGWFGFGQRQRYHSNGYDDHVPETFKKGDDKCKIGNRTDQ